MLRTYVMATSLSVAFLTAPNAMAQNNQNNKPDDTLVVTATRTPHANKYNGSSVTVLDNETLQKRGDRTVGDALKRVTGMTFVRNGGYGNTSSLRVRGMTNDKVKVLVDGVDVSDPSGPSNSFDFKALTINNIDRIEIVKGNQSALYGSDAIAGVIQIFTKKPQKQGFSGGTFAEGGSMGYVRGGANLAYSTEKASVYGYYNKMRQDGISSTLKDNERDGSRGDELLLGTDIDASENIRLGVKGGVNRILAEYDNSWSSSKNPKTDSDMYFGSGYAQHTNDDKTRTQKIILGHNETHRLEDTTAYTGKRSSLNYQLDKKLFTRDIATAGFDLIGETIQTKQLNRSDYYRSGYGQYILGLTDSLTATLSGRADKHQAWGTEGTYRTALAYDINSTDTILRASYGTGFRAPSLDQLYAPFYGNANLQPEKSKGFDLGFEQALLNDKAILTVTHFQNNLENMVTYSGSKYQNVQAVKTQGVETELEIFPLDWMSIFTNYTFTDAYDKNKRLDLVRVPTHQVNLGTDIAINDKWDVTFLGHYVGNMPDSVGAKKVQDYITLDAKTSYDVTDSVSAYARLENLADADYQELVGYRAPGRVIFAGLTTQF